MNAERVLMMEHTRVERSEVAEIVLRMAAGGLTVGLLIVLPALKILGLA
jgi:hypothetical protein